MGPILMDVASAPALMIGVFALGCLLGVCFLALMLETFKRRYAHENEKFDQYAKFVDSLNRVMAEFSAFYETLANQKLAKLETDLAAFSEKAAVINETIPNLKSEFDQLLEFYTRTAAEVKESSDELHQRVTAITGSMDEFQAKMDRWERTVSAASAKLDHVVAEKQSYDVHIINTFFKNAISEKILNYIIEDRYRVIPPVRQRMPWREIQDALNAVEDELKPDTNSRIRLSQDVKASVMKNAAQEFAVVQPCILGRAEDGRYEVLQPLEVAAPEPEAE